MCSVFCSLLLPRLSSLPLWQWQVYIPGPGSKQSHVIISPTSHSTAVHAGRADAEKQHAVASLPRVTPRHAHASLSLRRRRVEWSGPPVHQLLLRFPCAPPSRISPLVPPSGPGLRSHRGRPAMEQGQGTPPATERDIGFAERAVAAAGAAVISAVLVNPLDVAKVRR